MAEAKRLFVIQIKFASLILFAFDSEDFSFKKNRQQKRMKQCERIKLKNRMKASSSCSIVFCFVRIWSIAINIIIHMSEKHKILLKQFIFFFPLFFFDFHFTKHEEKLTTTKKKEKKEFYAIWLRR